jgi:hypothetical protein
MLVRTNVWKPSKGKNSANSKMSRGLLATAVKLSALRVFDATILFDSFTHI